METKLESVFKTNQDPSQLHDIAPISSKSRWNGLNRPRGHQWRRVEGGGRGSTGGGPRVGGWFLVLRRQQKAMRTRLKVRTALLLLLFFRLLKQLCSADHCVGRKHLARSSPGWSAGLYRVLPGFLFSFDFYRVSVFVLVFRFRLQFG